LLSNAKYFNIVELALVDVAVLKTPSVTAMNFSTVMKQPSAYFPVAMSLVALATVLGTVAIYGVVRGGDEGTAAHIFQLLIAAQVPIVAYFAIKWVPRAPRQALMVLALQFAAGIAALAPVFVLKL
jgi:hypothetical protein